MSASAFLPEAFLTKIAAILPSHLTMDEFISACQRPLRKSIRVNTLKISVSAFLTLAEKKRWQLSPIPWCREGFWIEADESVIPLGNTAEHLCGLFYIQEASSMMPVTALWCDDGLNEPLTVLDMAAAPGSKTTQIAAQMANQGLLIANEFSSSRLKTLHANIERCGIYNCALTHFDGQVFGEWLPESFDRILIDAPCSGEGTIRKDPDAMKNWSLNAIENISQTQKALIQSAFLALKPGGTLVYSTCTLSREENQDVCLSLKAIYGDAVTFESLADLFTNADQAITEEGFLHVFPQIYDCEGFFVAKIRKKNSVSHHQRPIRPAKFPFAKASHKQASEIQTSLKSALDIKLPEHTSLWIRDKEVWLFPDRIEPLLNTIRFSRIGIKLAETFKGGYRWQHQIATALSQGNETSIVALTTEQARAWFMGRDIRVDHIPDKAKGEMLVAYEHQVIGIGKWVNNRIKNGLPRTLVKDKNLF